MKGIGTCQSPVTLKDAQGFNRQVQCNHCLSCLIRRQLAWTIRLMLEQQDSESSTFVTLTYGKESHTGTLVYQHVQGFLKRLRKNIPSPVRFFCAGQYGELRGREHWHLCLFGVSSEMLKTLAERTLSEPSGLQSEVTPYLAYRYLAVQPTSLWPHGGFAIDVLNEQRCRYAAKYSLKTGYNKREAIAYMSRKPGLGLEQMRQIGSYLAGVKPNLESIPGWWRMGKSLYSLDQSSRAAFVDGFEGAGGFILAKSKSPLVAHSEALVAINGDLRGKRYDEGLALERIHRKEVERGRF